MQNKSKNTELKFRGETTIFKWMRRRKEFKNMHLIGQINKNIESTNIYIQLGRSSHSELFDRNLFELLIFYLGTGCMNKNIILVSFLNQDYCVLKCELFGCFRFLDLQDFKIRKPRNAISLELLREVYNSDLIEGIFTHDKGNRIDYNQIRINIKNHLRL